MLHIRFGIDDTNRPQAPVQGRERRRYVRYQVDKPASAAQANGMFRKAFFQPCVVMDASMGGACFRSVARYAPGQTVSLKFAFLGGTCRKAFRCRVTRVTDLGRGWYEYGAEFASLSRGQRAALATGLRRLAYSR